MIGYTIREVLILAEIAITYSFYSTPDAIESSPWGLYVNIYRGQTVPYIYRRIAVHTRSNNSRVHKHRDLHPGVWYVKDFVFFLAT